MTDDRKNGTPLPPTEKLYDGDAFLRRFTGTVLSCEPWKDAFRVALDRTAFYPEGGGQPGDRGVLGGVAVLDTHERDGVILHTCAEPLPVGAEIAGEIDWARRFDHMQQHSGEHILSGILCARHHCDNVGFHLGADTVTIDYNASITYEEALAAEAEANRVIWEDRPVEITWPDPAELKALSYRSKKEIAGAVRIVTFPGADCCACCGTHVARAGQAGPVKVLSCQKFREGVRIEILCGGRAVAYLSRVYEESRRAGRLLSAKPEAAAAAVERLYREYEAEKERCARLEAALFAAEAQTRRGQGDSLIFWEPLRPDSVRRFADAAAKECGGLAAVFAGEDGGADGPLWNYALVRCDGKNVDVRAMNAALHGRGGGRGGFAQGSVRAAKQEIEAFFQGKQIG